MPRLVERNGIRGLNRAIQGIEMETGNLKRKATVQYSYEVLYEIIHISVLVA